jgi:hypothetical protein
MSQANDDWPFDQPPNCAVITLKGIAFEGKPILHVVHTKDDHGWQFLGWEDADIEQAAVLSLEEVVRLDPSINLLANLPPGWHAWRRSINEQWKCGSLLIRNDELPTGFE